MPKNPAAVQAAARTSAARSNVRLVTQLSLCKGHGAYRWIQRRSERNAAWHVTANTGGVQYPAWRAFLEITLWGYGVIPPDIHFFIRVLGVTKCIHAVGFCGFGFRDGYG